MLMSGGAESPYQPSACVRTVGDRSRSIPPPIVEASNLCRRELHAVLRPLSQDPLHIMHVRIVASWRRREWLNGSRFIPFVATPRIDHEDMLCLAAITVSKGKEVWDLAEVLRSITRGTPDTALSRKAHWHINIIEQDCKRCGSL